MPELPEVETVCRGLAEFIQSEPKIVNVEVREARLRQPIPKDISERLMGQKVFGIRRRAKYLLWDIGDQLLINHLGMTGTWRLYDQKNKRRHDHFVLHLSNQRALVYNDPRRFGLMDLDLKSNEEQSRWLRHLGPEPLDIDNFNEAYLFKASRGRRVNLKTFIMDQKLVVGVGNIYVSEALFRSGLSPLRLANKLKLTEAETLVADIRDVLSEAIAAGGTTLKDFRQAGGGEGYFKTKLYVYGKANEACPVCANPLQNTVIAGRSSFWCKECQK